jgi:hypothetical protein
MKTLRLCGLIGLAILVTTVHWFCAPPAQAKFSPLAGLAGVLVKIDADQQLVKDGLSLNLVRTDVEIKLEEAAIEALSEKQWRSSEGHPQLYIQVSGTKVQENWKFYTFTVNLYLLQDVYIMRNDQTERFQAATWYRAAAGQGYRDDIRTRVKELVEAFAKDFNAANTP